MSTQIKLRNRSMELADRMEDGATTETLLKEYTEKWACSERTVERLIAFAKDSIIGRLRDKEAVLDIMRAEIVSEDFDYDLLSSLELEAELCRIARGNAASQKLAYSKQGFEIVHVKVSVSERIKAINSLLRMRGKFIPQSVNDDKAQALEPFKVQTNNTEAVKALEKV